MWGWGVWGCEPITTVWGYAPSGVHGKGSPEAESFRFWTSKEIDKIYRIFCRPILQDYLTVLRSCKHEGCVKTTKASPKTGPMKITKVLLMSVIGANESLGHWDEVYAIESVCDNASEFRRLAISVVLNAGSLLVYTQCWEIKAWAYIWLLTEVTGSV